MARGPISDDQLKEYQEKGCVLAKDFFGQGEIELLRRAAKEDRELDQHSFARGDGEGGGGLIDQRSGIPALVPATSAPGSSTMSRTLPLAASRP